MHPLHIEPIADGHLQLVLHESRVLSPTIRVEGCAVERVTYCRGEAGSWQVEQVLSRPESSSLLQITETWTLTPRGVRWEVTLCDEGSAWTAPVTLAVQYPVSEATHVWSAWADPRPEPSKTACDDRGIADGILPIDFSNRDWADPLVPQPWQPLHFWYGAPYYTYDNPRIAYCPFRRDVICMPMVTLLEVEVGLTLAVSLDEQLLDLTLDTLDGGEVAFTHHYHRLGEGRSVRFACELAVHEADWRAAIGWAAQYYAAYIDAPLATAHLVSGTSAYSSRWMDFDADIMRRMAFGVNWKASFDFPYMGLFIPPVAPETSWSAFNGSPATIRQMREYSLAMQTEGFHVLNYFNVTEFGTRMRYPAPEPLPMPDPAWLDPHTLLYTQFPSAILRIPDEEVPHDHQFYGRTQPGAPYWTWEGAVVTDCGESAYQEFLLEQARRHLEELPESAGLCIDRLDWLRMYNHDRVDGVSRIGQHDVSAMSTSWHALMNRLGPLLHAAGKVLFVNNHVKRLDLLREVDGIFDEFTYAGCPLNTTALLAVRKPALGWTSSAEDLQPDPDAFFQRYLYLGVFPMAPFPGNDHALQPGEWVTAQYLRYGPLMHAMRGRQWVLTPRAIEVLTGVAKANLFTIPGGWVAPIVFAGDTAHVDFVVHGLPRLESLRCDALLPDLAEPIAITLQPGDDVDAYRVRTPVQHGCAMVRFLRCDTCE